MSAQVPTDSPTDALVELVVGAPAHGGHCVARLDGRVVFVRHTLPGERVRARVTSTGARFWRADAVQVLEPSPDRVPSVWPAAGPDGVGGGELAHVALDAQRRWKAQVLGEQLHRLANDDRAVPVLAAPGDDERGGLAYRTRLDLVADADGRAGMLGWRSHAVHPLDAMPLATEAVAALGLFDRRWPPGARIEVAVGTDGRVPEVGPDGRVPEVGPDGRPVVLVAGDVWDLRRHRPDRRPTARRSVREQVGRFGYRVAADGFWQAHRAAPPLLVDAVLTAVGDVAGATVVDLYAGAGLFTVPLAGAVGEQGRVVAVEGDARALRDARRNVHDNDGTAQVRLLAGDVRQVVAHGLADETGRPDVVVLDPPRVGARQAVVDALAALGPDRVVYVACDPAALARDVDLFAGHGYRLAEVTGYDLFPMTHHVEAVALLVR